MSQPFEFLYASALRLRDVAPEGPLPIAVACPEASMVIVSGWDWPARVSVGVKQKIERIRNKAASRF